MEVHLTKLAGPAPAQKVRLHPAPDVAKRPTAGEPRPPVATASTSIVADALRSSLPEALRDPATVIEHAGRAPRASLPHAAEVERRLGVPSSALEVHVGAEAREACHALDARALTALNVVVFDDSRPSLSTVLHEVTHVVQQGAIRAAPAPRFAPGTLTLAGRNDEPERRATQIARGEITAAGGARVAVYRETLDEDPADAEVQPSPPNKGYPKTLLRTLLALLDCKDPTGAWKGIKKYSKQDAPFIKRLSEADDAKPLAYAEASEHPFTSADIRAIAEQVKGKPIRRRARTRTSGPSLTLASGSSSA